MSEKPLHVRVAEALTGQEAVMWHWHPVKQEPVLGARTIPPFEGRGSWALPKLVRDPGFVCEGVDGLLFEAPSYDTDWSATGPLIEKYHIDLWHVPEQFGHHAEWRATNETRGGENYPHSGCVNGPTPLIAACGLIIALAEAGKLEK